MKLSKYNIQIGEYGNINIIYNSLSDKFLFTKEKSFDNIADISSIFLDKLLSAGFVVEDDTDETQLYIDSARRIENDLTHTHLIINPTINCNFKCWYCYEKHVPSKMSEDTIKNIHKYIELSCKETQNLIISFFGGEPLLYYEEVILPILIHAKNIADREKIQFSSNCTTNGSLFNAVRINELKKYNFNFAQITLDGDRDVHNKTRYYSNGHGSYENIIDNIKELVRQHIHITLRINYTAENIQSIINIPHDLNNIPSIEKSYISVSFHKVWQEKDVPNLEIYKAIDAFEKAGFKTSKIVLGAFCYGDLRKSVLVNYNGDVYKCTAVDFEQTTRDGFLDRNGKIVWENDSIERRMRKKFSNKPCLDCKIFPICHGGCSSKPLQNKGEYCIFDFDENKKLEVVKEKLLYYIKYKWNKMFIA